MNITVDKERGLVRISADTLAYFSRTKNISSSKTRFIEVEPTDEDKDSSCGNAVNLAHDFIRKGVNYSIFGVADFVYSHGGKYVVEKVRECRYVSPKKRPENDTLFLAQSVVTAYLFSVSHDASDIILRMTYSSEKTSKSYECVMNSTFLHNMTEALFMRAVPFIKIETEKRLSLIPTLSELPFPYPEIRDAQREFITKVHRAAKRGENLLVSAPTGVGKTVSALYPALRAIGEGYIDKVFYLTAKTVTGKAAQDAVRDMSKYAPTLRCVTVIAKERTCKMTDLVSTAERSKCLLCPLMGEIEHVSYEERRDNALLELLEMGNVTDTSAVLQIADKYKLCPYELSLDLSMYAEVVICDYNYVFDPNIRFRRYFVEPHREKYMFLVDEAHNLPDRAREMYSSGFDTSVFLKLYKQINIFENRKALYDAICAVIADIKKIRDLCEEEKTLDSAGNEIGYYLSYEMHKGTPEALSQFVRASRVALVDDPSLEDVLMNATDAASSFLKSAAIFDKGFAFYAEMYNGKLSISSKCLDPSSMLSRMLSSSVSAVMFSATLTPMDYFADVLGVSGCETTELDSPYDKNNLCLFAVDSVSTRYPDREASADEISEIILAVTDAREGNYIVFFPSYEYMKTVYEVFRETAPEIRTVIQSKSMSIQERNMFLSAFSASNGETLVGFCVLGGVFSEGVDLKGEKLIGTVIVGTGMPKISAELNILSEYYEITRENGRDFAYTYPAMIKVLQAAGRVIRSENDRGVVVLIDDRYSDASVYRLFPKHWRHIRYTSDPYSLASAVESFWDETE